MWHIDSKFIFVVAISQKCSDNIIQMFLVLKYKMNQLLLQNNRLFWYKMKNWR